MKVFVVALNEQQARERVRNPMWCHTHQDAAEAAAATKSIYSQDYRVYPVEFSVMEPLPRRAVQGRRTIS